jgi:RimJ/RimL family protein N-acetyltransferase
MERSEPQVVLELSETSRLRLVLPDKADARRMVRYYDVNREHFAPWESLRSPEFYTEPFWSSEIARMNNDFLGDRALTVVLLDKLNPDGPILGQVSEISFAARFARVISATASISKPSVKV